MVDVAHNGHNRRTRDENRIIGLIARDQTDFNVRFRDPFWGVAEFLNDQLGAINVDHIGDLMHRALLHQIFDEIDGALGHAV